MIQLPMQVGKLYCTLINMLGWLLVPEPCGGKVAASTGRHQLGITTEDTNQFKVGKCVVENAGMSNYIYYMKC